MSSSFHTFDEDMRVWVNTHFPSNSKILDVGPGRGKFAYLLPEYRSMDAVEVFEPFVEKYNTRDLYRKVFINDIRSFDFENHNYNLVIMGDVLEHLSVSDAQALIHTVHEQNGTLLVAVPYEMPQGEMEGNTFEEHLQPDLTHELMSSRYPDLELLVEDAEYGVYHSNKPTYERTIKKLDSEVADYNQMLDHIDALLKQREWETAATILAEAIADDSNNADLVLRRGVALEGMGKMEEAAAAIASALRYAPSDEKIVAGVVAFLHRNGLHDDAKALAKNFTNSHGTSSLVNNACTDDS